MRLPTTRNQTGPSRPGGCLWLNHPWGPTPSTWPQRKMDMVIDDDSNNSDNDSPIIAIIVI